MSEETTFYEELKANARLDLRDNRGKRHDLALVLLGVMLSILRKRDGVLSSIHRSMKHNQVRLCNALNIDYHSVVSRAQLPRILEKVNGCEFNSMIFKYFKVELSEQEKDWFAGDGKELRGSILKGDKRGEASLEIVRHRDKASIGQSFYNGKKESEKPALKALIEDKKVFNQKITADALHLYPDLTAFIAEKKGVYLIGLKGNQKTLLADMKAYAAVFKAKATHQTIDKGHGRLDKRDYAYFDVRAEYYDKRWAKSKFASLFRVCRTSTNLKTNKLSTETCYYMSNGIPKNPIEYFEAMRNHWSIEVNNHYRDVSLKEDSLRTKKSLLLTC